MADCNIRNIPDGMMRDMKKAAAQEGTTLREWCILSFKMALEEPPRYPGTKTRPFDPMRLHKLMELGDGTVNGRVSHSLTCKCFICRPPKADQ